MQEDQNPAPVVDQSAPTQPAPQQESSYIQQPERLPQEQTVQAPISWTASEYIAHEKSKSWFMVVAIISASVGGVLFLVTKDITVVLLALVCGFVFGFYGAREPKLIDYEVNDKNLVVGPKRFDFREFKSFSVVPEGAFSSIILWPHKRFAQLLTMYYPPEHEEQIIQTLGSHLPQEVHKPDIVETVMKNVRF